MLTNFEEEVLKCLLGWTRVQVIGCIVVGCRKMISINIGGMILSTRKKMPLAWGKISKNRKPSKSD